ncbi:FlgO family outer membrane protein [Paraglaciecola sp.]|uniref:FlgO family outer membrane protein n=1 Tax=Paraglaciecola sp. TaxID=1920173 RepID=UPI003EF8A293
MKYSLIKMVSPLVLLSITGCSSNLFSVSIEDKNVCVNQNGERIHCDNLVHSVEDNSQYAHPPAEPDPDSITDQSLFSTSLHFNLLNDYVEQMALDIRQDLADTKLSFPIAVASFVHLDSSLTNTDTLGNQLSEQFISELRDMGLAVSDHRITGNLQVTPKGDFAFSRDTKQLKSSHNVGYVLTGTMTKQMNGMLINARVVGLTSNMVVASSSKLIPNVVL